jgi:superfamily II DNA or RNA helicase
MNINQAKDKIQRDVLNAWRKNKYIGTAECATGFGKTRCAILAAVRFAVNADYNYKILIIVPNNTLKHEWEKEFKKWKHSKVFKECVQVECINTARKFKNQKYDFVIADEIHNYIKGTINSKFFKNNKYDKILGLSATIEDNLIDFINGIAPICYTLSLYEAVELGLVSEFTVYNIPVELNDKERKDYNYLSSKIRIAWENYGVHSWKNISARKEILYNAKSKMRLIKKITELFGKDDHGVIFSMTKDYSDKVANKLGDRCLPHHSGITKKNRVSFLKRFADGRTKVKILSSAKTLDEGVNIPRLSYSLIASNSSTVKQMNQRVGRCIRLGEDGKHAIIIRLYCKDTQEEKWIKTSQAKVNAVELKNLGELTPLIQYK